MDELIKELKKLGIRDAKVLKAFRQVDRKAFVPSHLQSAAYLNRPLPIGEKQTIPQPYIVAYTAQALKLKSTDRVLEVGFGSGYQSAILSVLAKEIFAIEILPRLAARGIETVKRLHIKNIHVRVGDGALGWSECAPYDKITVAAATSQLPKAWLDQLKVGGILIAPIGEEKQNLVLVTKGKNGFQEEKLFPVLYVPLTGKAQTHLDHGNVSQFV